MFRISKMQNIFSYSNKLVSFFILFSMRKLLPIIILLMFFSLVIYLVASTEEQTLDIEYVTDLDYDNREVIKVCVLNENNQYVLINATKHNDEDIYIYVLKLYDHYRNNLPLSYKSPLKGNFEVQKVKKVKEVLNIELKMMYFESGVTEFLNALIWSYQDLGIEKINAKINGNNFVVEKNANINPVIESSDLYNNEKQIIYYLDGEEIIPVTYFHKEDKLQFLMNKVASRYNITYDIQVIDSFLVIEIVDNEQMLSKAVLNLIIKSIDQMGEFSEIVIIVNGEEVYNKE